MLEDLKVCFHVPRRHRRGLMTRRYTRNLALVLKGEEKETHRGSPLVHSILAVSPPSLRLVQLPTASCVNTVQLPFINTSFVPIYKI